MDTKQPIDTVALFPVLQNHLVELLRGLSAEDWQRPTICKGWAVQDIAAHILDVDLRLIALYRDNYAAPGVPVINSYQDLVNYLNKLNNDWVAVARRLSPTIITDMLEQAGPQLYELLKNLPPFENAVFSVAWAGESVSPNWFHIARQYTELWHHQQQIRLAVGKTAPLMSAQLYHPLLDTFVRAMPHTYRDVAAPDGTLIKLVITGEGGDSWFIRKLPVGWEMTGNTGNLTASAVITIYGEIAWRIFTKGITREEALPHVTLEGDQELGKPALGMLSVMV